MLKKENRLQKDRDFRRVFKRSQSFFCKNIVVRTAASAQNISRFGFVIGNKIEKRAVRRNAIKRQFRVVAREALPVIKKNVDIIVIVHKNFPYPYNYAEMREQLKEGLKKAGLLT